MPTRSDSRQSRTHEEPELICVSALLPGNLSKKRWESSSWRARLSLLAFWISQNAVQMRNSKHPLQGIWHPFPVPGVFTENGTLVQY